MGRKVVRKIANLFWYMFSLLLLLFSHQVVSDSLWPQELQHTRLSSPSLSLRICSNSCPLSQWCHPTISSFVTHFSCCPQSFPASGSFSNESALHIRWPKYWSFSFSINPSNEYSGLISFRINRFGVNYNTHYLREKIKLLNSYKMLKIKMLDGLVSG